MQQSVIAARESLAASVVLASATQRLRGLDALRGLAALSVVLFHYTTAYEIHFGPYPSRPLLFFPNGHFGVELFFCISGFVILGTIERTAGLRRFAIARFARIYPAYFVCALISLATLYLAHFNHPPWTPRIHHAARYHADWFGGSEFHRSELLDAQLRGDFLRGRRDAVVVFARSTPPGIALPLVAGLFFYWTRCGVGAAASPADGVSQYSVRQSVCDRHDALLFAPRLAQQADAAHFVRCIADGAFSAGIQWRTYAAAGLCGYDCKLRHSDLACFAPRCEVFRHSSTSVLGEISYSLYLIHQVVGFAVMRILLGAHVTTNVAICFTISAVIAIAFCLREVVEKPAERLIKKFAKEKTQTAEVPRLNAEFCPEAK